MKQFKNIVVLGAGESGNGAAILAHKQGYKVFVSDFGSIKKQYKEELNEYNIPFEEKKHSENIILAADLIIKSPGIPEKASIIKKIREKQIEIISEIEWAYRFKGESKIIAITGSNGKSTTTSLMYHILKTANYDASMVGNIGISFAKQVALFPTKWYVIEVSSFQLDDIKNFKPDIAVLLNITPDHLDRYGYDINNYAEAKFKIAINQDEKDTIVINIDDNIIKNRVKQQQFKPNTLKITMNEELKQNEDGAFAKDNSISIRYNDDELKETISDLVIKGKHNTYNSMAAGISARVAGIRNELIRESFSTFNGLEHRLEYVATIRGVEFINDSKGTNLNSVWYALESMTVPVVLILGGQDKGNDYSEIEDLVEEKVRAIVCLGLDNTHIIKAFGDSKEIIETQTAKDAVKAAYSLAERGDVVLLSPGCASFDLFENFEDRGRQFKQAVREL